MSDTDSSFHGSGSEESEDEFFDAEPIGGDSADAFLALPGVKEAMFGDKPGSEGSHLPPEGDTLIVQAPQSAAAPAPAPTPAEVNADEDADEGAAAAATTAASAPAAAAVAAPAPAVQAADNVVTADPPQPPQPVEAEAEAGAGAGEEGPSAPSLPAQVTPAAAAATAEVVATHDSEGEAGAGADTQTQSMDTLEQDTAASTPRPESGHSRSGSDEAGIVAATPPPERASRRQPESGNPEVAQPRPHVAVAELRSTVGAVASPPHTPMPGEAAVADAGAAEGKAEERPDASSEPEAAIPKPVLLPDGSVDPDTIHPSLAPMFLKDADTGKMYPLEGLDDSFFATFSTFDDFLGLGGGTGSDAEDALDSDSGGEAPAKGGKRVGRFFKSVFGKKSDKADISEGNVKVHTHKRDLKELTKVMLCQHIESHKGPIWTMKFSPDGQYLATAGQDTTVQIWRVSRHRSESDAESTSSAASSTANPSEVPVMHIPTPAEAAAAEAAAASGTIPPGAGAGNGSGAARRGSVSSTSSTPEPEVTGQALFDMEPVRTFRGHKTHVVDLDWSHDHFLLSASMDSYVRLWHVSRDDCVHKFQHPDCVTSVAFHPSEEHFFLTGCFDKKLRIWNRQTGRVRMWEPTPVMVTAAAFSPNGRVVVAGLYNGQCVLYNMQANGFAYHTQIDCKNRRGRLRKGRKVTGIVFASNGSEMLVTTNDSRCRLISLDDFSMTFKYAGLRNNNMQIKASCDSSGDHVICGSENKHVYVWRTRHDLYTPSINPRLTGFKRNKNRSYEHFRAHNDVVTVALFAPDSVLPLRPTPPSGSRHMVIVTAGMAGDIKVYENTGLPRKM